MREKLHKLIKQAISPGAERTNAEKELLEIQNTQPSAYIITLCGLFCESEADVSFTAGILIRNGVLQVFTQQAWETLNASKIVKEACFYAMKEVRNGKIAASILSGVYKLEMASNSFNDFYSIMENMISKGGLIGENAVLCLVQTTISMKEMMDMQVTNDLLIKALNMQKPNLISVLESLNEVQNSIKKVMRENAEKWIQLLLGLCKQDKEVAVQAINNIKTFISYGIDSIAGNIEFINRFMIGLFEDDEDVSIQAIEYFYILSELENTNKRSYLPGSMYDLISSLFRKLKKRSDYDESIWSSHKASSACIQAISINFNILSDQGIRSFIGTSLMSVDLEEAEFGMIAFGSCLNHYITLVDNKSHTMAMDVFVFVRNMSKHLIENLDKSPLLETSLFTLAKICEANLFCIEGDELNVLVDKTGFVLKSNIEDSTNAIWIISSIASFAAETKEFDRVNYILCSIYPKLIQPLIDVFDMKFETYEPQVQTAIFTTLQSVIRICPDSFKGFLERSLWVFILQNLELCYSSAFKRNRSEIYQIEDILCGFLCVAFEIHLKVQSKEGETTLRKIFTGFLSANLTPLTLEEVYRCLSALCSNKSLLITHVNDFIPFILRDLNLSDRGVIVSLITLIGDISASLQLGFLPYANQMVPLLIDLIKRGDIPFDIKPQIILLFSDIVLSIGYDSKQYFFLFFTVIEQAASVDRDFDPVFVDNLRNASLLLIESFFYSFGESDIFNYKKEEIIQILEIICKDDKSKFCVKECLRLCGEVCVKFNLDRSHWTYSFVNTYLNDVEYHEVATEVYEMCYRTEGYTLN